jgi:hypothetical protein
VASTQRGVSITGADSNPRDAGASNDWLADTDGRKSIRGSSDTIATTAAISNNMLNAKPAGFCRDITAHSLKHNERQIANCVLLQRLFYCNGGAGFSLLFAPSGNT